MPGRGIQTWKQVRQQVIVTEVAACDAVIGSGGKICRGGLIWSKHCNTWLKLNKIRLYPQIILQRLHHWYLNVHSASSESLIFTKDYVEKKERSQTTRDKERMEMSACDKHRHAMRDNRGQREMKSHHERLREMKSEKIRQQLYYWEEIIQQQTTVSIKMMKCNAKAPSWLNQLVH